MPFTIIRDDIANVSADAIVNTANPDPVIGAGTDAAIHRKAGPELLEARKAIGKIRPGDAAITPAFRLDARYVIHAVGPVWVDGEHDEAALLASCYRRALDLAVQNRCDSIAFPLISTGAYLFPKPLALQIAIREISDALLRHDLRVILVVYDPASFALSEKLFSSVSDYLKTNYVEPPAPDSARANLHARLYLRAAQPIDPSAYDAAVRQSSPPFRKATGDLDALLASLDAGFSETLLALIDKSGKKDSEIYKKANVDRKLFSKIRSNPDYRPSKATALAFAFALELSLDETRDFLARAGFALSRSSKRDVIVEYFLSNHNHDIFELNQVLFAFDQPLIGA